MQSYDYPVIYQNERAIKELTININNLPLAIKLLCVSAAELLTEATKIKRLTIVCVKALTCKCYERRNNYCSCGHHDALKPLETTKCPIHFTVKAHCCFYR